jgi:hypothetical protein
MLPTWTPRTIAVLSTTNGAPHAIPVSAPVRAGDREILLSLHRSRGSLARLRECPAVALTILTDGNVAFTARGHASVVEEAMASSPDYAAVTIAVEQVDDHRQPAFVVDAGVGRDWVDEAEKAALGARVAALKARAAEG